MNKKIFLLMLMVLISVSAVNGVSVYEMVSDNSGVCAQTSVSFIGISTSPIPVEPTSLPNAIEADFNMALEKINDWRSG